MGDERRIRDAVEAVDRFQRPHPVGQEPEVVIQFCAMTADSLSVPRNMIGGVSTAGRSKGTPNPALSSL
jgi:hypothetical protein